MKTNQRIVAVSILASILLVSTVQANVFADRPQKLRPELKYFELPSDGPLASDSTNNVGIRAVFHFPAAEEVVDSFKSFSTKGTGFDRQRGLTTLELQGLISGDKPHLYKAVDMAYSLPGKTQHDYKKFDIDLMFTRGDQVYRVFSYENCIVKNYNIETLFDKEETFMGKTDFAYVDIVEFECAGVSMMNPSYDQMKKDQIEEKTTNVLAMMKNKQNDGNDAKKNEEIKAKYQMQKLQQKTFR
ncbi:MAG TPA: hypothetical protein VD651_00490 [Nitrosarchaeum sp.]|nr:hypothetical protein [Nitrosarchaeum sp.]